MASVFSKTRHLQIACLALLIFAMPVAAAVEPDFASPGLSEGPVSAFAGLTPAPTYDQEEDRIVTCAATYQLQAEAGVLKIQSQDELVRCKDGLGSLQESLMPRLIAGDRLPPDGMPPKGQIVGTGPGLDPQTFIMALEILARTWIPAPGVDSMLAPSEPQPFFHIKPSVSPNTDIKALGIVVHPGDDADSEWGSGRSYSFWAAAGNYTSNHKTRGPE